MDSSSRAATYRGHLLAIHGPSGRKTACLSADRRLAREALWFATGPEERKAMNLAGNPSCVLTTGRSDLVEGALDVVLEGKAEQVTVDPSLSWSRPRSRPSTRPVRGTSLYATGRSATAMPVGGCSCSGCARCEAWASARAITSARRPGRASAEPYRAVCSDVLSRQGGGFKRSSHAYRLCGRQ